MGSRRLLAVVLTSLTCAICASSCTQKPEADVAPPAITTPIPSPVTPPRPRVSARVRCLEACRGGTAEMQAFCGAIEDEQLRLGCYRLQLTGVAGCFAFCYRSF